MTYSGNYIISTDRWVAGSFTDASEFYFWTTVSKDLTVSNCFYVLLVLHAYSFDLIAWFYRLMLTMITCCWLYSRCVYAWLWCCMWCYFGCKFIIYCHIGGFAWPTRVHHPHVDYWDAGVALRILLLIIGKTHMGMIMIMMMIWTIHWLPYLLYAYLCTYLSIICMLKSITR